MAKPSVRVQDYRGQWLRAHAVGVNPSTRAGYAHLVDVIGSSVIVAVNALMLKG